MKDMNKKVIQLFQIKPTCIVEAKVPLLNS